ncbi:MAG: WG repeat-containing protein [Firmicutes bacterium]|nr:WG repeat-containing protein [Bacillota bacterium]
MTRTSKRISILVKRSVFVLSLLISVIFLFGCGQDNFEFPDPIFYSTPTGTDMWKESSDGTYDLYDPNNTIVVDTVFDYLNDLSEFNLNVVGYEGRYGVIDHFCHFVILMQYDEIKMVINLLYSDETHQVTNNTNQLLFFGKNNDGWNAMNLNGELVTNQIFDDISSDLSNRLGSIMFNIGLSNLRTEYPILLNNIEVKIGEKWGLMDFSGAIVIPIVYDEFSIFNGPTNMIKVKVDEHWGVIDANNQIIMDLVYKNIEFANQTIQNDSDLWGIYDSETGSILIEPIYQSIDKIDEKTYYCLLDGNYTTIFLD